MCWQSPLKTSTVCLYQPLESLLWAAPSHISLYSAFYMYSLYFSFVSYFIKQESPVLQLWLGKGTCVYLWTFQSYTHPVIMMQAVSEHCIWCLIRCSVHESLPPQMWDSWRLQIRSNSEQVLVYSWVLFKLWRTTYVLLLYIGVFLNIQNNA